MRYRLSLIQPFCLTVLLCFFHLSKAQQSPFQVYTQDTIHLKKVSYRKTAAYNLDSVMIFMNYKDFKKEYHNIWSIYNRGMKFGRKAKKKGGYVNPEYEPRYKVIDSFYKLVRKQARGADTIYLSQAVFDPFQVCPVCHLIPKLLEKGDCAIKDELQVRHFLIIRQKGSGSTGPSTAASGRAYFLQGAKQPFFSVLDGIL